MKDNKDLKKNKKKNSEAETFIKIFQNFKQVELKNLSSYVLISKIFINDNKHIFNNSPKKNEKSRNQIKNFLVFLKSLNAESIKINLFIRTMRTRLININQKYSKNLFFNEDEIKLIENSLEKCKKNFDNEIEKLKEKFSSDKVEEKKLEEIEKMKNYQEKSVIEKIKKSTYSTLENFKLIKAEKINKLREKFDLYEKTILKDNYYAKKTSYVKDQLNLLSKDITILIEDDLNKMMKESYDIFINDLSDSLQQKLKKFLSENFELEKDPGEGFRLNSFLIVVKMQFLGIAEGLSSLAFLSGPPGWIIGGVIAVLSLAFAFKNNLGMWSREGCFDDLIKLIYESINKNLHEIITKTTDQFKNFTDGLGLVFKDLKEILKNVSNLLQILKSYEDKSVIPNKVNLEDLFENALKDLDETEDLKKDFRKVIFK